MCYLVHVIGNLCQSLFHLLHIPSLFLKLKTKLHLISSRKWEHRSNTDKRFRRILGCFRSKKHEIGQNISKCYMFYCALSRLSSCDHLDLEKSPSAIESNGTATGSRYIGKIKKTCAANFHPVVQTRPAFGVWQQA